MPISFHKSNNLLFNKAIILLILCSVKLLMAKQLVEKQVPNIFHKAQELNQKHKWLNSLSLMLIIEKYSNHKIIKTEKFIKLKQDNIKNYKQQLIYLYSFDQVLDKLYNFQLEKSFKLHLVEYQNNYIMDKNYLKILKLENLLNREKELNQKLKEEILLLNQENHISNIKNKLIKKLTLLEQQEELLSKKLNDINKLKQKLKEQEFLLSKKFNKSESIQLYKRLQEVLKENKKLKKNISQ